MFHYTIKSIALPGDLSTPVSTYLKVRNLFAQSALMESSDYHGSENNRSFIGLEPLASFSVSHGRAIMLYPDKTEHQVDITDSYSVSDAFDDFIKMFSVEGNDSAYCGLYGYTSFNAVRYFEHIDVKDSKEAKNDAPDIHYIMYKYLLVFNDFSSELKLLEMLADGESCRADEIVRAVMSRNYATYTFHAVGPTTSPLPTANAAMCFRLYSHAALYSIMRATTLNFTVPCAASTPRPTCFTSTLADFAYSALRPKRTAASRIMAWPTSTP